jgi:hypothetical protein
VLRAKLAARQRLAAAALAPPPGREVRNVHDHVLEDAIDRTLRLLSATDKSLKLIDRLLHPLGSPPRPESSVRQIF